MISVLRSLLYFALAGCLILVLFGAAKGFYVLTMNEAMLAQEGIVLSRLPAKSLYIDVMELHLYALWGALGGLVVGVLCKLLANLVASAAGLFSRRPAQQTPQYRAEEIIRRDREARAEAYLARRRAERNAGDETGEADDRL